MNGVSLLLMLLQFGAGIIPARAQAPEPLPPLSAEERTRIGGLIQGFLADLEGGMPRDAAEDLLERRFVEAAAAASLEYGSDGFDLPHDRAWLAAALNAPVERLGKMLAIIEGRVPAEQPKRSEGRPPADPGRALFDGEAPRPGAILEGELEGSARPESSQAVAAVPVAAIAAGSSSVKGGSVAKKDAPSSETEFSASRFFLELARWPLELLELVGAGTLEILREIPMGFARGAQKLAQGDLSGLLDPLRGAANAVYDAITFPLPLAVTALKPLWYPLVSSHPLDVRYETRGGEGVVVVDGGLPDFFDAGGVTLSGMSVLAQSLNEPQLQHELVHSRQYRGSFVLDFLADYGMETLRQGYRNNPYEKEAYGAETASSSQRQPGGS